MEFIKSLNARRGGRNAPGERREKMSRGEQSLESMNIIRKQVLSSQVDLGVGNQSPIKSIEGEKRTK